jgi:hypothetical protein
LTTLLFFLFGIWSLWEGFKEDGYRSVVAFQLTFCFMCFGVFVIDLSHLAKHCNSHFRDSEELAEVEAELVGKFHHCSMLFYGLHFKLLIGKFYLIYRMLPLRVIKVNLKINLRSVQLYSIAECFSFIII